MQEISIRQIGQYLLIGFVAILGFNVAVSPILSGNTPQAPAAPVAAAPAPQSSAITAAFYETFDDPDTQARWLAFSGDWSFESGALVQPNPEGFDYGISRSSAYDQFILRVQFSHRQGAGAGILFNMPEAHSMRGAQIVRYLDENNLAWGYFDNRNVFQSQGSIPVTAPENAPHVLEVATNGSTYGIMLDGRPVMAGIPLHSPRGYIGLTASNASVAFDEVELFTGWHSEPNEQLAQPISEEQNPTTPAPSIAERM